MTRWWLVAVATLAAVLIPPAVAAGEDGAAKPLFVTSELLHLTIKGPFGGAGDGLSGSKAVPGSLMVAGGSPVAVTLAPRGITRRDHAICPFGPIRVTFVDKPGTDSPFKGQKSLKLVTHCRASPDFQQYLLLEYSAYRIGAVVLPHALDVRLATIDYVDMKGRPVATRYGIFIEDVGDLAKRSGLHEVKTTGRVAPSQFDATEAARYALFQDLIGNLDWGMNAGPAGSNCCHNSRLIAPIGTGLGIVPVPYDYDFSGLVDAPYATPPAAVNVADVRVRRYRGFCRHNPAVPAAVAEFRAKQAAVLAVLDQVPGLEQHSRHKAADYLGGFFAQVKDDKGVTSMLKTCLK